MKKTNKIKVTEEILSGLKNKRYHNNELIRIGDTLLFVLLCKGKKGSLEPFLGELTMEVIMIREDHLTKYYDPAFKTNDFPYKYVKIKKNDTK